MKCTDCPEAVPHSFWKRCYRCAEKRLRILMAKGDSLPPPPDLVRENFREGMRVRMKRHFIASRKTMKYSSGTIETIRLRGKGRRYLVRLDEDGALRSAHASELVPLQEPDRIRQPGLTPGLGTPRLCQGCRSTEGEHDFGATCTLRDGEGPNATPPAPRMPQDAVSPAPLPSAPSLPSEPVREAPPAEASGVALSVGEAIDRAS